MTIRAGALAAALCLLAAGCRSAPPRMHFRLEVGPEPVRTIVGFIEGTDGPGPGYDVAVYDEDGDGVPETRKSTPYEVHLSETDIRRYTAPAVTLRHHGLECEINFAFGLDELRETPGDRTEMRFEWYVWDVGTDHAALFSDGLLVLTSTREKVETTRIGPPFCWEMEADQLGPSAVVRARLTDSAGSELSAVFRGEDRVGPRITIPGEAFGTEGEFG